MKHSINLEPADECLDGKHLDLLIQRWLDQLAQRSEIAPETVAGYINRVAYFREWWADIGPQCNWELKKGRLMQFGIWLSSAQSQYRRPLGYNSRRDVFRRLRQCFKWALDFEYITRDIRSWVPAADGEAALRERASLEQLSALMQAAGRSGYPVRDQAFVALLIGTGLRKMEAVSLDVKDIHLNPDQSGTASVRKAKKVKGRTVQGRMIAFDSWTGHYLATLIDSYSVVDGPLFRTPEMTRRIGSMAAYRMVKRAIQRAGLDSIIEGPHDLRRNFATWFSKQHRGELHGRLLSKQLGHARFMQTDQYILHDADDLLEVIRSPLADLPIVKPAPSPTLKRRAKV